jgi:adhesin transport system membrane fusion protein
MNARSQQLAASIGSLESQMRQRHGELEAAERSLQLIAQEREVITKLVERGLEPKLEAVRAEKTYAEAVARVTTLKAAIDELLERMKGARKESQAAALSELTKTMNEVVQIRKSLPVAANRVDRTVIRSPVEGVVNRVLASTIGGVIKAGEPVIEIVPADAKLVFEAKINPADIGFVKTGQSAMVKLSTYDFSIFGSLAGRVDLVSSDSVSNDKGETYYLVKVELIERRFKAVDKELALLPGMTAQIDIITGKRSVLTYLSAPITKTLSTAFREK